MAPPPNRRSSYSRRAQYTNFLGYIAAAVGALIGGALLLIAIANPSAFSGLRSLGSDTAAPVAAAAASGRTKGYDIFGAIGGYFSAAHQNAALKRDLAIARAQLIEAAATAQENQRLKALLQIGDVDTKPIAYARLVASSASSTRRFATISAGSVQGVTIGMPVRSPLGLVGRVLEVGRATSRVLLITDGESVVPVRRASDSLPAFAQGRSDGRVQIRLISLGINPLKRGDAFVTSGSGGLYRPGIPIAVVDSLTRDGALGRVLSDPAASDYVSVEPVWASEAVSAASSGASPAPQP